MTGLPGIIVTIWCQMRGSPKDMQRTVFQPTILLTLLINIAALAFAGAITVPTLKLYALGMPFMAVGAWFALNSTAISTMPPSAKSFWCCCWYPE